MQVMDGDKECISVAESELNHLLFAAVNHRVYQASEAPYSVVGMNNIVVDTQLVDFLQGHYRLTSTGIFAGKRDTMIALKYLMVRVAGNLMFFIHPTGMQGVVHRHKGNIRLVRLKNSL